MSKESWLAEFYPIAAAQVGPKEAVGHSLQKWKGMTKESLVKHELTEALSTSMERPAPSARCTPILEIVQAVQSKTIQVLPVTVYPLKGRGLGLGR